MALDQEYFDAIHIDVVKRKYYNANKVEAVFEDIRRQAAALTAENERMRGQLALLEDRKAELGDAMLSAQAIYREIVAKANARAEAIIAEAEEKAAAAAAETQRQQEYSVQRLEAAFNRMKQRLLDDVEAVNGEWQSFLCGLYPEEPALPAAAETAPPEAKPEKTEIAPPPVPNGPELSPAPRQPADLSADLEEKVGAIAREMLAMDEDDGE